MILRKIIFIKIFLIFISLSINAQSRISGFVRDSTTQEVLVGAHIIGEKTKSGTATDNNGYFAISSKLDNSYSISFVGYKTQSFNINNAKDTLVHIFLQPNNAIDEVVVTSERRTINDISTLSNIELQQIPSLGAKPDVMKALQLLPGITSQNEGASTLLVRGGNPGENLYLIDNTALIYVNHLGGFTSVFNPDMINNINLYKGGFPSVYGGKLSSIVDIAQREGDANKRKGAYSIGITDLSFVLEGPTSIENSTFIITGRKTVIDPFMALVSTLSGGGDYVLTYGFHDINGKFSWRPDAKNKLSVSFYQGDDYLNYRYNHRNGNDREKARLSNVWGNWLFSTKWGRVHNTSLYSTQNLSIVRSRLKNAQSYFIKDGKDNFEFNRNFKSLVQDISYKWDFKADILNNWKLDFGLQTTYFRHNPNKFTISNNLNIKGEKVINSLETALYAENVIRLRNFLQLRVGVRGVNYVASNFNVFNIEPRANANVQLFQNHRINLNYMQTNQFSHLLFTQGEIMSNEVWVPANKNISPSSSTQFSGGWNGFFKNGMYDVEISAFHKMLNNVATYKEGYSSLMGDTNWRNKIETDGSGEAYGIEFFLRKTKGLWNGFVGYSWSRAFRQFEYLNNGKTYAFDYDRPHNLSLNINRRLNDKFTFSSSWVFQSGMPFTPVVGRQYIPNLIDLDDEPYFYEAFIYGEKNSARMRCYHRLDLALNYTTQTKKGNKSQWTFAIYNAYNRKNPYSYMFTNDMSEESLLTTDIFGGSLDSFSLYQISFFPLIPSVSYKVFFE